MSSTSGTVLSSEEEDLLFGLLLEKQGLTTTAGDNPIVRTAAVAGPPSFSQEAMWFVSQLAPESTFYNVPMALRLRGPIEHVRLEQALRVLVERHEVLRTRFVCRDSAVEQVVCPAELWLELVDLAALTPGGQEAEVRTFSARQLATPFDLAAGPLLRAHLLRLSADEHVLVLIMHHIICDAWSSTILLRELGAAYDALAEGRALPFGPPPLRYVDYARWQRERMSGARLEPLVAYWKQQLGGAEESLALPFDHPRPAEQRHAGGRETIVLPAELAQSVRALAQAEGATLFMLLLALFNLLLSRYGDQRDIVVAAPTAGRDRAELESLVGLMVNTLVLRTSLDGDPTFRDIVGRVRSLCLDAFAHGDLPFEKLVQELHPRRDLSRNPLFQVMFVLQNAPQAIDVSTHFTVAPLVVDNATEKFDLSLEIEDLGAGLRVRLSYDRDLFEPGTAHRLLEHFRRLAQAVIEEPGLRLSEVPLIAGRENRLRVLDGEVVVAPLVSASAQWSVSSAFPDECCIQQLFEAQVRATPDAPALAFQDGRLTYAQLNQRANQLAHRLRRLGVGPETLVGVHLGRSLDMVVGLLGILKAGGAYVPLDPEYPAERLAYMIEDSALQWIVSSSALAERIPRGRAALLVIDREGDDIEGESSADPTCISTAQNLAYVLYTSGSTGRPKGVAIQHRSAAALLDWARQAFTPEDLAGVLASTSICFDLAVYEIFTPLISGGMVIVAENVLHLQALPPTTPVTLINTVPSALTELLRVDGVPASVRTINLAGEPLLSSLVEAAYRVPTIERVYNLYGPTEDTTYSTGALIERGATSNPTIGRPLTNKTIYLLDGAGTPVPLGAVGEIYIGGAGVARGYLGQPALTAAKFVPDPFGGQPSARLYRTGDLGRYRADGNIEFLGRVDQQVKIRGFRIELPEIENTLRQHPAVGEAMVVVRDEPQTGKRLIAYVVARRQGEEIGDLRSFVKAKLPAFMVPAAFVTLAALPLTPNGKIDRRALPTPERLRPEATRAPVSSGSAIERVIDEIWRELLGVEEIDVNDNFFDLGGHSLLLLQMRTAVRDKLGKDIPLVELFRHSTVRALAEYVATGDDDTSWNEGSERGRLQRSAMNRKRRTALERE